MSFKNGNRHQMSLATYYHFRVRNDLCNGVPCEPEVRFSSEPDPIGPVTLRAIGASR